jgi:hypothetical protein
LPVPKKNPQHKTSVPVIPVKADTLKPVPAKDTLTTTSLFKGNLLPKKDEDSIIHYTRYDYAVALILFVSFIVYVWLYVTNRKRLNQLIRGFYINRFANQLSRDEYSISNRISVLLSAMFLMTMTLFAAQAAAYYGFTFAGNTWKLYGSIALGLIVMYTLKILVIRLAGSIFKTGKEASDYLLTLFLFINVLGLFMLPVVTCLAFVKQVNPAVFLYAGFTMIIGFLCVRLIRGMVIGFSSARVSGFYLFLYLCTLEILPFIVLLKLFLLYAK